MRGKRGRGLLGFDSRSYLRLGQREEVGRRGPAAVGGGGCGGGVARPRRERAGLDGFVEEWRRGMGLFIAEGRRWSGAGPVVADGVRRVEP